jgi:hypothetical protein
VWEWRGEYKRVEEKRRKVRKQTDVPLQTAIDGRLDTGRLGTVIISISFVVRPSQGSLEHSLWISPD